MLHEVMLFAHVIGACVLFGTGAGIAFFMLMAHRTHDPAVIAHTAGIVVIADTVFTATAVAFQPIAGFVLARLAGWPVLEGWVGVSLALYVLVGLFWLSAVWMQLRIRDLAIASRNAGEPLPPDYHQLFRWWFAFGFPAFFAVIAIIWLMLTKPAI